MVLKIKTALLKNVECVPCYIHDNDYVATMKPTYIYKIGEQLSSDQYTIRLTYRVMEDLSEFTDWYLMVNITKDNKPDFDSYSTDEYITLTLFER